MRTNFAGLFLVVGMGLIVMLLGLGALSMAGLVSFIPAEFYVTEEQEVIDEGPVIPRDKVSVASTYIPASTAEAAAIISGDALFKANCAQCHAVYQQVVGPKLAGIDKRRSMPWIVSWVQNSAKVVASGDDYAVRLYNDNGKQQMPSFDLSKKEIEDIVAWIKVQPESAPAAVNDAIAVD